MKVWVCYGISNLMGIPHGILWDIPCGPFPLCITRYAILHRKPHRESFGTYDMPCHGSFKIPKSLLWGASLEVPMGHSMGYTIPWETYGAFHAITRYTIPRENLWDIPCDSLWDVLLRTFIGQLIGRPVVWQASYEVSHGMPSILWLVQ